MYQGGFVCDYLTWDGVEGLTAWGWSMVASPPTLSRGSAIGTCGIGGGVIGDVFSGVDFTNGVELTLVVAPVEVTLGW